MVLSLKDRLAREVATLTGETLTDTIRKALTERPERERPPLPTVTRAARRKLPATTETACGPDVIDTSAIVAVLFDEPDHRDTPKQ
jgi:hypothetical protein